MSKHPNRSPITKHHLIRSIKGLVNWSQVSSLRQDDLERVFEDYIEYKKDMKGFKKFIDGKYKQPKRKRSRKSTTPSE
jgi:hypothetical protein